MKRLIYTAGLMTIVLALLAGSSAVQTSRANVDVTPAGAIRITPPAPVFDQAKRLEELAARRKRVAESIGSKAMLVLFSGELRVYANDVEYQFRQENNLYY